MNKRRIVCFGDSNTWGYDAVTGGRFDDDQRWTQILQHQLGEKFQIIEEGLSGRTTVFDDPLNEGMSGLAHVAPILGSHAPMDLVILMLGTNDCKERFSATPQNICNGLVRLIQKILAMDVWRDSARILVAAPVVIQRGCYHSPVAGEMGADCVEKSMALPALFQALAARSSLPFYDVNQVVSVNPIDFMHFDAESHKKLGFVFAERIISVLSTFLQNSENVYN